MNPPPLARGVTATARTARSWAGSIDFEPFPFFANGQWRGGTQEIDPALGRASLNARGGTAGRDSALAVIRRWIAPQDGKLSISGVLSSQPNSTQPQGNGVRGRIVSSRKGTLGAWLVHGTEEPTDIAGVEVAARRHDRFRRRWPRPRQSGGFAWAPVLRMEGADEAQEHSKLLWDAAKDFNGAAAAAQSLWCLGTLCPGFLEANEFMFLD